jgi:DNA-binding LacI/PurR family transcriptional regulator/DNA-binding transcriptional regulator YhcF (GntR family)
MGGIKAKQRPTRKDFKTRYESLKHELKTAILNDKVAAGELLPTEQELVNRSKLSRGSVRKLLIELADAGLISRQQGRGSVVREIHTKKRVKTNDVLILTHSVIDANHNLVTVPEFCFIRIAVFFEAIVNRLRNHDLRCHRISCSDSSNIEITDYLARFKPLGAIVFSASSPEVNAVLPLLVKDRIPVISIGPSISVPPEVITLSFDNLHMGLVAAEHLIQHGHKKIACLGCQNPLGWADTRMNAFVNYCRDESVQTKKLTMGGDVTGYVETEYWLNMGRKLQPRIKKEFPEGTAVFCINDLVAQGFIESARKNKISVPHHVSVIGCGDDSLLFGLSVTTVSPEAYRIGTAAVDYLIKLAVSGTSDITSAVINVNPCVINHNVSVAPPRGIF